MNTKRFLNSFMVLMMLLTSLAVSQTAGAATEPRRQQYTPERLDDPRVEGEIVVVLANAENKSLPAVVAEAFATAAKTQAEVQRLTAAGAMVLQVNEGEVAAKLDELNNDPNILYAEPNYIFALPEIAGEVDDGYRINSEYVIRNVRTGADATTTTRDLVSIAELTAMKRMNGSRISATYPNDPGVFQNYGWSVVGADIVWPNTTPSVGVCVVDTGVDNLHKEFTNRLLPGYDFVWGDTLPQDDNGHGTHVTGILIANHNNNVGMAGASSGKVVPVKVLDAQGYGTNFDVAAGIQYCANRGDIKVINLSLGAPNPSETLQDAIEWAVVTKNKLVVAAAGNNGSTTPEYPAGYSNAATYPAFANRVISVAASGKNLGGLEGIDYDLPYPATNYGSWVSVVGPGGFIYSTTPWDKSFYMNFYQGLETRYGTLSGTSMATPFVAAAAARYWGYKPGSTNAQVGTALKDTDYGNVVTTGAGAWDASMLGKVQVNIAKLLDRGALITGVIDASNGTPLAGAVIYAYQGGASRGSAVIPTFSITDIINLPVLGGPYTIKVNKTNYTVGAQSAYRHELELPLEAGTWTTFSDTAVPPKSANFTLVLLWKVRAANDGSGLENVDPLKGLDLDMDVWLPDTPNPFVGSAQPAPYVVGMQSDPGNPEHQPVVGDPYGSASNFPFARLVREGGYTDDTRVETILIRNRYTAYAPAAANPTLPYYPGEYGVYVTDYGQTIDHDGDGCGDNYGRGVGGYDPDYTCVGTQGIPLMGTYFVPYVYVWKDGVIKKFVDGSSSGTYWSVGSECNDHWWRALTIYSELVGTAPTYDSELADELPTLECDDKGDDTGYFPYLDMPESGGSSTNID